ncbi:hypothetical protein [Fischerella thermalis]|uniref:hypothetical protein n=1 Tax=Fischerella thermalis TaxID=372787 RepID=UPI00307D179A
MTTKRRTIRRPQQFEESKMEGYFMISKRDAAIAIANKLTGNQCRLWLYLMMIDPFADYTPGGEIKYHDLPSIADIAVAIGSSSETIEKDLRKLRTLRLYDYRTVTVQGHNLTSARAKAEAERLSKEKSKISSKPSNNKTSAYLSSQEDYLNPDGDYLNSNEAYLSSNRDYSSSQQSPETLSSKHLSVPHTIQTYTDFIQTLSEEERASFLNFCKEKTKNLSQQINDIEAWLAHKNKAGQNRWQVYYEQYLAVQHNAVTVQQSQSPRCDEAMRQFQQEIEQQRQFAMQAWRDKS